MDSDQQDMIAQFTAITGVNPSLATTALQATGWDLDQAVSLYFEERASNPLNDADEGVAAAAQRSEQPAAGSASSSAGRGQPAGRPQQMSFSDLQRGDPDDEEEEEKGQDLFAGGEKSGLAVQNPNQPRDHFRNIMHQARQNRARPPIPGHEDEEEEEAARPSNFTGRAQTLGGDDAPSRIVGEPSGTSASAARSLPRVTRTLHLWQDGVSVDDGPLFRFDDPANATILQDINQGRAPRSLLDVEVGQEVDLNLEPHKGENYVAPKKKFKPFSGQGQRLGSPTPGLPTASSSTTSQPSVQSTSAATSQSTATTATPQVEIDSSQPTLQLQIRLGSGARLSSRFNTTHTIGDVYEFVDRAATESVSRPYTLQTTFPTTEFNDRAQILGDISDFKRGGVLVQKWK